MSGSAFRRSVQVFVDRNLSPEARSKVLAETAIRGRQELIQTGKAAPSFRTSVDGHESVPEAQVKPEGIIVYRFNLLGEAAVFAMAFLRQRVPTRSGQLRDSLIYAVSEADPMGGNGRLANQYGVSRIIRPQSFDPQKVNETAREVLIFSRLPYARKADVQLVGNRRLRFPAPPGMYDDAAAAVRRRFPTLDARRVYTVKFANQWIRKTGSGAGKATEAPALVIGVR